VALQFQAAPTWVYALCQNREQSEFWRQYRAITSSMRQVEKTRYKRLWYNVAASVHLLLTLSAFACRKSQMRM
jgi:negative regulator of sigma E activity